MRRALAVGLFVMATVAVSVGARAGEPASSAAPAGKIHWAEHFDRPSIGWLDPFNHDAGELKKVYGFAGDGTRHFLHARHDATSRDRPPAMHFGKAFTEGAAPLETVKELRWKWRALKHPTVGDDAWEDMAGGIYVVIKQPSMLVGGKGFKFGWLAKPGRTGQRQHGLLEVERRHDAAGPEWKSESVDLCALYRQVYGACEGEKVLYVGVVSDADGTRSVAEADYADFELVTR